MSQSSVKLEDANKTYANRFKVIVNETLYVLINRLCRLILLPLFSQQEERGRGEKITPSYKLYKYASVYREHTYMHINVHINVYYNILYCVTEVNIRCDDRFTVVPMLAFTYQMKCVASDRRYIEREIDRHIDDVHQVNVHRSVYICCVVVCMCVCVCDIYLCVISVCHLSVICCYDFHS
jgi:hypothetical protein